MLKKIVGIIILLALAAGAYVLYSNPKVKDAVLELVDKKSSTQTKTEAKNIVKDKEALITLAETNMQSFALSLKKKDMTAFYIGFISFFMELL